MYPVRYNQPPYIVLDNKSALTYLYSLSAIQLLNPNSVDVYRGGMCFIEMQIVSLATAHVVNITQSVSQSRPLLIEIN